MRLQRLLFSVVLCLFLVWPLLGQTKVYLPLILKGNGAMIAQLEITDGTTTINLINLYPGVKLSSWTPRVASLKGGGTFQDSALAGGRRLANAKFGNVFETFDLKVSGWDQDELIGKMDDLLVLLQKAVDYWVTDWQDEPVWLRAKAKYETNARYALIHAYSVPQLDNPYTAPFFTSLPPSVFDNITLIVERGHWLGSEVGTSLTTTLTAIETWQYKTLFELSSSAPAQGITNFTEDNNGDILASAKTDIWRYDGAWAIDTALPSNCHAIITTSAGTLIAGDDGQILRNAGAGWSVVSSAPTGLIRTILQLSNGRIILAEDGSALLWFSDDDGATWSSFTPTGSGWSSLTKVAFFLTSNNTVLGHLSVPNASAIIRSTDNGQTWNYIQTLDRGVASSDRFIQLSSGDTIFADQDTVGGTAPILRSQDDGQNWAVISTVSTGGARISQFMLAQDGTIYVGEIVSTPATLWASVDNGFSWKIRQTFAGNSEVTAVFQSSDGQIWLSIFADNDIYVSVNNEATATIVNDTTLVANKYSQANITLIKTDDGGAFVDKFPVSASFDLFPGSPPAVNDALYIGIDDSLLDATFFNVVFNLSKPSSNAEYTVIWEYWDSGAWSTLTVTDGTTNIYPFDRVGENAVCFVPPTDWAQTAVDGDTAYWIRVRISVITTGPVISPTQSARNIYTITQPHIEIDIDVVKGSIPALAKIKATNISDKDGRGGSGPDLWDNRLLMGLRSISRGSTFQAYLNAADEQNPAGVTVSVGDNTAFANDITTPTTRRSTYSAAIGDTDFAARVTFALGSTIARDFYGEYHAFVRGQVTAGDANDIDVRLQINTGTGGITQSSKQASFQTTTAWELLDLGQVKIPASSILSSSDLSNQSDIVIQARNNSGAGRTVYFFDLVLIPVDEWVIDTSDGDNSNNSVVGRVNDIQRYFDIDSLTQFKRKLISTVRTVGSDLVVSIYDHHNSGPAILQANAQQRLWFLAARTDGISSSFASFEWISEPWVAHSVQVEHNPRYLGMRGSR